MFAFLAPAALKLGAKMLLGRAVTNAKADIAAIPPKVKLAIAGLVLLAVLFFVHQHVAHKRLKAQFNAGYAKAIADVAERQKKTDAAARQRKQRIDGAAVKITQKAEAHHEQAVADIARDAGALRLRRPPRVEPIRVTGGDLPGFPGAAGGRDGAASRAVPGLAEIPWLELVDHGELCDVDRAKLETLQQWLRDQRDLQQRAIEGKAK